MGEKTLWEDETPLKHTLYNDLLHRTRETFLKRTKKEEEKESKKKRKRYLSIKCPKCHYSVNPNSIKGGGGLNYLKNAPSYYL